MNARSYIDQLRPRLAAAAQRVYNAWEQDAEGCDVELGVGGICQDVAEALLEVLDHEAWDDIFAADSHGVGDQHVWAVVVKGDVEYYIDIPPSIYETGAGYCWRKLPDVRFTPSDIVVYEMPAELRDNPPEDYPLHSSYSHQGRQMRRGFFAERERDPCFIGWRCQTERWSNQRLITLSVVFEENAEELLDMLWLLPKDVQQELENRWPGVIEISSVQTQSVYTYFHQRDLRILKAAVAYLDKQYGTRVLWVSDVEPMTGYGEHCYAIYLPEEAVLAMREDYAEDGAAVYIFASKVALPRVVAVEVEGVA